MMSAFRVACAFLVACSLNGLGAADAPAPTPEQLEFFEQQVRPLLAQHCQECHGAKKQEAALRLDSHAGFLKGSDSGPVMTAGNIDGSRLLQVLKYADGDTQMPPKGKLPDDQIVIVRKWLELGAPWPAEKSADATADLWKSHWAFQPIKRPSIPTLNPTQTAPADPVTQTAVDSFITASLREKQLSLSRPASRYTFVRRATLDLWGMPPSYEQVAEFLAEANPDAHDRLIDRLLASPFYGQRWGRHWLDVARYADSKGYVFTAEPRYPYSYTYRDYVVDALNADTPYDQFITEQLAADLAIESEQRERTAIERHDPRLAALGFLTVGRRYLNNNNDIIDDRIDVVARGLQGLTVGCARCHDHKFDPIPTADYYSLFGVFSSTNEPDELPLIGDPKDAVAYRAFQDELAKREEAILNYEKENLPKLMNEIRDVAGDVLQQIAKQSNTWSNLPVAFTGSNEPRRPLVKRWQDYLTRTSAQPHPVMGVWNGLARVDKPEEFPNEVTKLFESWSNVDEAAKVNPLVRQALSDQRPATLIDLAKLYGKLFQDAKSQWTALQTATPEATQLADTAMEQIRQVLYGEGSPAVVSLGEARRAFGRDVRDMITNLKRQADNLKVTSPGAPPRAMVVRDAQIQEPVIFIRGNPGRPGKQVPRQFLEVVAGAERKPFIKGSGRLELAQSIVAPTNPLTARVIVNRLWQHHFGTGIVPTPSDFGTRGLAPSHPQLLDWLAIEMAGLDQSPGTPTSPDRWSIKHMHRLIMASAVYQQSSGEDAVARGVDPENRLLWRMPRQRLDFEAMRDSLLVVAGQLNDSIGGQPFDGVMNPSTTRRTIYALINRNDLPGVFRSFDFADTDTSAADRPQTTVPQQSLFALNSPFILEQARRVSAECQASSADEAKRVDHLYLRVFSRLPSADERSLALQYLAGALTTPTEKLTPWDRLAQVLLMTNEFEFVD